jgi:hypothetical protein
MFKVLRKWFTPSYKNINKFDYSPDGFQKAKRWAKAQPHPFLINLTLWDYVDSGWIDSEYKLHEINKIKQQKV